MGSNNLNIPSHWDYKPLVDCTSNKNISYGIVQPGQHDEGGIGIIRVNNFENGELNISDVLKVTPDIESKFAKTRLNGGEVLLTLVGSTGQSAVVPDELKGWNVARAVAVIKPSDEVTAEWLNICLQSSHTRNFLDARANTTVQKTLNLKDVKDIPIPLPPKDERDELESIAVNLNKKITLNRQINQTLEQMAQTLFKSWFVDFDPVVDNALDAGFFEQDLEFSDELLHRAEARKTVRECCSFKPLPDTIRQFFPSSFEECAEPCLGLGGWIPKGWKAGSLNDITNILNGFAFKSKEFQDSGFGVIKIKNICSDKSVDIDDIQRIDISVAAKSERFLLKDGDLLMAMTGATVGKFGSLVTANNETYYLNQRVAKFEPVDESSAYLYSALNREIAEAYIVNAAQGSAQPNISSKGILAMPMITAPQQLRKLFNDMVNSSFQQIIQLRKQNIILTSLRDILLPKLISGELHPDEIKSELTKGAVA